MAGKQKKTVVGRSMDVLAMRLRRGAGKHGDRRLRRLRTRAEVKRNAMRDF